MEFNQKYYTACKDTDIYRSDKYKLKQWWIRAGIGQLEKWLILANCVDREDFNVVTAMTLEIMRLRGKQGGNAAFFVGDNGAALPDDRVNWTFFDAYDGNTSSQYASPAYNPGYEWSNYAPAQNAYIYDGHTFYDAQETIGTEQYQWPPWGHQIDDTYAPVSYTHLTLPTICSV